MNQNEIYLDHAAATPLRPEVLEAMRRVLEESFGNPSSSHLWGRQARHDLEGARARVAAGLGVQPDEVRFVRGGTASVNAAVLGRARAALGRGDRPTLYQSATEHSSVREAMREAEREGCEVRQMGVSPTGEIDLPPDALRSGHVALVSAQWVNQETGLVLDLPSVAARCASHGVPLHVDAIQAFGKVPTRPTDIPFALLSVSAHKIGGPRGLGALVVRRGEAELHPLLFGGKQEGGLWPGTEDVAGAVGFAAAVESTIGALETEAARIERLRNTLEASIAQSLPDVRVHGREGARAPHILNLGVPGVARDVLVGALDLEGVGASAGSACQSGGARVSWVLEALYGPASAEVAPLRLSLGWTTTEAEIERAAAIIATTVGRAAAASAHGRVSV